MSLMTNQSEAKQVAPWETGLREIDRVFAGWASRYMGALRASDGEDLARLENLALAVSHALNMNHTCLDLEVYQSLEGHKKAGERLFEKLMEGMDAACVKQMIGTGTLPAGTSAPLVCSGDGQLVWMHKYHHYEKSVAGHIRKMCADGQGGLSGDQLRTLDQLYPDDAYREQREAVETALKHRFSVITGGPGTGKTYTAARIIALMARHGIDGIDHPKIALAAPTGKAANRVFQSLDKALNTEEIKQLIAERDVPRQAATLHSLLKMYRGSSKPRMNAAQPLRADVVIIDEASMISLPMMHKILQALPGHARLVLLGDKDQLSSVEAGSVLAELCAQQQPYIATISKSQRYKDSPEIGQLADAINAFDANAVAPLPDLSGNQHVTRHRLRRGANPWKPGWLAGAVEKTGQLTRRIQPAARAADILAHQTDFQVLCALRNGPAGVTGINAMVANALGKKTQWYPGMPVMVLTNDHQRKLYNGDVGLVLPVDDASGEWRIDKEGGNLRACFPIGDGSVKAVTFAQMPAFETCYAMTVHKSQGSEYDEVLLVLPADSEDVHNNPVITRELVYTGITRARDAVEIWCGDGVLGAAVKKRTVRMSGLGRLLNSTL